jgi:CBS domain-containing protein
MVSVRNQSNTPLTASDIMTPSPRTCSPFSSVLEAVMIFRDADCGAVPVLKDGKPIGVLTDRDVALALASYPDLVSRPVEDIMTDEVITIDSNASIDTVREKFGEKSVRRLLVVGPRNELVGIIAWSDIAPYSSEREVGEVVTETVEQP